MKKRSKALTALAVILLFGAALMYLFQVPIATALLERTLDQRVGRDATAGLPDGLHVVLCGTGSPFPDPSRAGPCTMVIAGKRIFVVDTGEGGARNLMLMGLPVGRIERLFLTHYHSDHIDGLGPMMLLRWAGTPSASPLPVAGPPGVEAVVAGFNQAHAADNGYRTAHHGPEIMPPSGAGAIAFPFAVPVAGKGLVILDDGGLKVTAFRVNHAPISPAVGYRFDYQGRSVVLSGDTIFSPSLVAAARGADLLVHEAIQPVLVKKLTAAFEARGIKNTAQVTRDILNYHTTPEQAADAARLAGVKALVLNHIVPPMPMRFAYAAFLGDAHRHYSGPITVGEDGMMFSLPARGTTITEQRLL
ncbi:MBL fold metallo-hydrolase [Sphingomonas sp. So64.6b]|uniref:MBL fold metallo-hydrolase n=1 Tax=Sphingomonas sp. So64.6b TaxID=2997354 RepID=UPI001600E195|nr:MBL fold metallo-hydrolase [Sphingomonas sp. So64.6b]QNA86155.1 MBL fold metallo-hydrolase [Sphingomonas sp. So64.6b]